MMYIAFKRSDYSGAPITEQFIGWWTGLKLMLGGKPYIGISHVELIFSDGQSFSSVSHEGGVRFKEIGYNNDDRWLIFTLPGFDAQDEATMRKIAEKMKGKDYDWLGCIIGHAFNPHIEDATKWYCSEAVCGCFAGVERLGMKKKDVHKDPASLYYWCKKNGLLGDRVKSPLHRISV